MLEPGVLTLAATPIGNPLDASQRLVRALQEADVLAAEDTRRLRRLLSELDVTAAARVISYYEHNESARAAEIVEAVRDGKRVVIVTDAGMPTVSDPGYRAVRAVIDADLPVTVLPGPSAVLTALAASGLPTDRFAFDGFLPRTEGKLRAAARALRDERRTVVLFESPRRTAATLAVLRDEIGPDRPAALARELTKTHEEVVRGTLAELAEHADATEVLGEVVLVISGADEVSPRPEDLLDEVLQRAAAGERLKDAAKAVAAGRSGISARDLYERALAARQDGGPTA
ncbi:16S rRNA (cytidine(1402)-2'-O)-methyltransferase [Brachybacterium sp. EF45031]|uniref:16S rRNA (cytidine(1402)-2'-O)-methyltransferase n=1 Tax=Brachybacterium sillae TaxID=2810536 RepID=UPI00217E577A|nr:16S rRNA (cytidine(1402)-2'-O)-methyltransferase [Brachybacterium sillae]MCS6712640.1 16S rRNA (cytidine(1402)-2'-O)-methyltransferase [Brachybacterium sillae]